MHSSGSRTLIWFSRLGLAGWILFEFLNWVGVLPFTLSFTWFGLIITAVAVWSGIELVSRWLRRRTGEGLSSGIYLIVFAGISFDALGDVAHWYVQYEWYDQVAHAVSGGVVIGLIVFNILWRLNATGRIQLNVSGSAFFAWTSAALVGALYEIEEYLEDVVTGGNRLGDGPDTANDLLWNVVGAGLAIAITVMVIRRRRQSKEVTVSS